MPRIDLKKLGAAAPEPRRKIDPGDMAAAPGFRPAAWQASAPDSLFSGHKPAVTMSEDVRRVLALPRRPRPEPGSAKEQALIELARETYGRPARGCVCDVLRKPAPGERSCILHLLPGQAWALHEISLKRGLLGGLQVGSGKTILGILAPLAMPDCNLALLLCPPGLVGQLILEYKLLSQHWHVPSLISHGRPGFNQIVPGAPVLHVLPYSLLQREDCAVFLDEMEPDHVIADEAHSLRSADATRTKRVLRYFASHPDTRFCGWTGTMTDSSLEDYGHLSFMALREGSPLPIDPEVVKEWGTAIDPSDWPAPPGPLLQFCEPGEHVRSGFSRRLVETPGVVTTTASSVSMGLQITERPAPAIPAVIEEALRDLRASSMRPDGEELVDPLAVARCARELALGLFYRWRFPRGEPVPVIEEWLAARKSWRSELRDKLKEGRPHLDSPLLCARAAIRAWSGDVVDPVALRAEALDLLDPGDDPPDDIEAYADAYVAEALARRGRLPRWKADTWPRWRDIRAAVRPLTEAVRIDDFVAQDAAAWGLEHLGIIWYGASAFGAWVAELSGLPHHSGGPKAGERIAREDGTRSLVCSIKSHGTGRDGLQRLFHRQLFACALTSATQAQQALGRLHRQGQRAPVVYGEYYSHTPEFAASMAECLRRAEYVEATFLDAQKITAGLVRSPRARRSAE